MCRLRRAVTPSRSLLLAGFARPWKVCRPAVPRTSSDVSHSRGTPMRTPRVTSETATARPAPQSDTQPHTYSRSTEADRYASDLVLALAELPADHPDRPAVRVRAIEA